MNKLLVTFVLLGLSATCNAATPVTIINNNPEQLSMSVSFCNKQMCTLGYEQQLSGKGTSSNAIKLMFPAGTNHLMVSSATLYDVNNNKVATLDNKCHGSVDHHNVIVMDTYGTNRIYCVN